MTSIGETLRRERIKRNLDLGQISRELKISSRMLEAIEDERFDKLPGGVFTKSFVRQYAHLLGLDEEEVVAEVRRLVDPPPEPAPQNGRSEKPASLNEKMPVVANIHVPRMEEWESVGDRQQGKWASWLPAAAMVVAMMLICSGVYSWWTHSRHAATAHVETQAPAPVAPAPPQNPPQQNLADRPAAEPAPPQSQATALPPQSQPAAAPSQSQPAAAPPLIQNASAPSAVVPAPHNPNASVLVQVSADEPVWVSARSDGKFSFSGTLSANEVRTIEANEMVVLKLGNAGGVTILLNGKPIGAVGTKGQVREIQLTSGGFQIVAPPKPAADPL
jgi:cytoskeleton protein RodZ